MSNDPGADAHRDLEHDLGDGLDRLAAATAQDTTDAVAHGSADAAAQETADATAYAEPSLTDERLAGLRAEIDAVGGRPVGERLAVFERVNAELASELAALDEL